MQREIVFSGIFSRPKFRKSKLNSYNLAESWGSMQNNSLYFLDTMGLTWWFSLGWPFVIRVTCDRMYWFTWYQRQRVTPNPFFFFFFFLQTKIWFRIKHVSSIAVSFDTGLFKCLYHGLRNFARKIAKPSWLLMIK